MRLCLITFKQQDTWCFSNYLSIYNENYTTQEDYQYIYSIYDEDLINAKYIDRLIENYNSISEEHFLIEFEVIDFEKYK